MCGPSNSELHGSITPKNPKDCFVTSMRFYNPVIPSGHLTEPWKIPKINGGLANAGKKSLLWVMA